MWPNHQPLVFALLERYVERNMNAVVHIVRMTFPITDLDSNNVTAVSEKVVYAGPARIYGVSGPTVLGVGDETTNWSSTYISIPRSSDPHEPDDIPQVDDLIQVLEHHDPLTVRRVFRVVDVEDGGQFRSVRRMQVTGLQRGHEWDAIQHPSWPIEPLPADWPS